MIKRNFSLSQVNFDRGYHKHLPANQKILMLVDKVLLSQWYEINKFWTFQAMHYFMPGWGRLVWLQSQHMHIGYGYRSVGKPGQKSFGCEKHDKNNIPPPPKIPICVMLPLSLLCSSKPQNDLRDSTWVLSNYALTKILQYIPHITNDHMIVLKPHYRDRIKPNMKTRDTKIQKWCSLNN